MTEQTFAGGTPHADLPTIRLKSEALVSLLRHQPQGGYSPSMILALVELSESVTSGLRGLDGGR